MMRSCEVFGFFWLVVLVILEWGVMISAKIKVFYNIGDSLTL